MPQSFFKRFLLLFLSFAWLASRIPAGAAGDMENEQPVELWFFWSSHCPHCLDARPFWRERAGDRPWLRLHDLELTGHPAHVQRYMEMAAELGREARFVPCSSSAGSCTSGGNRPGPVAPG